MSIDNEPPVVTPWGRRDYCDKIAEGIYFVGTPGHGGYWLSEDRAEKVDENLRKWADKWAHGQQAYSGEWYEEDCCAAAVIVTFPKYFRSESLSIALGIVKRYT